MSVRVIAEPTLSWPRKPDLMRPVAGLSTGFVIRAMV